MLIVVTSRKTMSWAMAAIAGISQRRVGLKVGLKKDGVMLDALSAPRPPEQIKRFGRA